MKIFIHVFLLFIMSMTLFGQEKPFAPEGAEWSYLYGHSNLTDCEYFISAEEEIVIDGKICTTIHYDKAGDCFSVEGTETVCSEGRKTYLFRDSTFHLLFDLDAEVGDTIVVFDEPFKPFFFHEDNLSYIGSDTEGTYNYFAYIITEKDSVNRNGISLIKQKVENIGDWFFWEIVELEGVMGSHHPFGENPYLLLNGAIYGDAFCYRDDSYFFPLTNSDENCWATGIPINSYNDEITILPNPARNIVRFDLSSLETINRHLTVYNSFSQIVLQKEINNEENIDISSLNNGLYFWEMDGQRGKLVISR